MKIIRVLLLMLVSCSSFAETPDFYKTICDTNLYSDNYLCIPFYDDRVKKLLVIKYWDLQKKYLLKGINKAQFKDYILKKITSKDTISNYCLDSDMLNNSVVDFNKAETYSRKYDVEKLLNEYCEYSYNKLFISRKGKIGNQEKLALIYTFYKNNICTSINLDNHFEFIFLGFSKYKNRHAEYWDAIGDDVGGAGYYVCIPFYDGIVKKTIVINYQNLEYQFSDFGYTREQFRHYIQQKVKSSDTINNNYIISGMDLIVNEKKSDGLLDKASVKQLLSKYYNKQFRDYDVPYGDERKIWVDILFKHHILVYDAHDGSNLKVDLDYSKYKNLKMDE